MNGDAEHLVMPASIILPNGKSLFTKNLKFSYEPTPGQKFPWHYKIEIPEINLQIVTNSLVPNQDSNNYWEGISDVDATYDGKPVKGFAYIENTLKS
jgi:predicted secreted hydrolase